MASFLSDVTLGIWDNCFWVVLQRVPRVPATNWVLWICHGELFKGTFPS